MGAIASHLWQSTIVAALAAALAWLLSTNRASVRYWVWFAASMKFLVPFAAVSAAVTALPWPDWARADAATAAALSVVFRLGAGEPLADLNVGTTTGWLWIAGVWLAGTAAVLARWTLAWNRVMSMKRRSEPINEGPLHDALRRVERLVGIARPTKLVSSGHQLEPGIVGILSPVLVWPRHLSSALSDDHIEPIITHELMHVRRRDNLLATLHMLVSAAFWFHPVVWWIGARLVEERERACDEQVLAAGQSPARYAAGILKTCEHCLASPLVNVPGVTGGDLKERIRRIMQAELGLPLTRAKKAALVLAICATVAGPVVIGAGARPNGGAAQNDDQSEVQRPGGDVTTPKLRREVKPQYSERAKAEKIEGEVVMECVVKADGTVGDVQIVRSLDPDLDQAAVDAAKQWLFEPGTKNGKPIDVLVTIAMAFTLK